jgi:hypothetical protein
MRQITRETKKKILKFGAVIVLAIIIFGSGGAVGWEIGRNQSKNVVVSQATNIESNESTTPADFNVFWQAWQDINN